MIVNKHKLDSAFLQISTKNNHQIILIFKQTGPRTHLKNYQSKDTAMQLGNTLSELSIMSLQVITA